MLNSRPPFIIYELTRLDQDFTELRENRAFLFRFELGIKYRLN
jgi:hypothetical protein